MIGGFGAAAQAGFGAGIRVMQAVFLPAMAIAFTVPAMAGALVDGRETDLSSRVYRISAVNGQPYALDLDPYARSKAGESLPHIVLRVIGDMRHTLAT